jgi:hypothetical protein
MTKDEFLDLCEACAVLDHQLDDPDSSTDDLVKEGITKFLALRGRTFEITEAGDVQERK